jgi:hypothetical protein
MLVKIDTNCSRTAISTMPKRKLEPISSDEGDDEPARKQVLLDPGLESVKNESPCNNSSVIGKYASPASSIVGVFELVGPSPCPSVPRGRREIRPIKEEVTVETQRAEEDELERLRRVEESQKLVRG